MKQADLLWLAVSFSLVGTIANRCAIAQILPDGNTRTIEGGTVAGGNLSHSFQEFSRPTRLVEAQGWTIGSDGEVILTENPIAVTPQGTSSVPDRRTCRF